MIGKYNMNRSQWEDFCSRLNNPTQENIEERKKFLEECSDLVIIRTDDGVFIKCDLDEEEIRARLNSHIKE